MGTRVGMDTDPHARIQYWMLTEGYTQGRVLASGLTSDAAHALASQTAEKHGFHYRSASRSVAGEVWSVYMVWGGVIRPGL